MLKDDKYGNDVSDVISAIKLVLDILLLGYDNSDYEESSTATAQPVRATNGICNNDTHDKPDRTSGLESKCC